MSESLSDLELRRFEIVQQIQHLGDFRAGSITNTSGRCGKPNCRCHRPGQSGHGPNPRLTYKVGGKTVTESLSDLAALRKAEREIAEFRKYQQLNQEFLEVSAHICRLRPNEREAQALDQAKKKRKTLFSKKPHGK